MPDFMWACIAVVVLLIPALPFLVVLENAPSEKFSLAPVNQGQEMNNVDPDSPKLVEATVAATELGISPSNPIVWQDGSIYYIAFEDAQVGGADQYAVECSYLEEVTCVIPEKETPTEE